IMKRSVKSLIGYSLRETDGELGKVDQFYFDDETWTVRYLVVQTGNWLSDRKVLISPKVLQEPDWVREEFPVNLTKEQIRNSPDIDTKKTVSRLHEEQISSPEEFWGSESYAHGAGIFGLMPSELAEDIIENETIDEAKQPPENIHLRSTEEVTGYTIHATDGEIGKVIDFIIDDSTWEIKFLVVETGSWLNSRKVLLFTRWIKEVNWENSLVIVDLSMEAIRNSPEFDASEPVNEVYERKLYDYYGRPQNEEVES
ncbi:MAG TPA: PRC-barrel domain-containing protein, partial [Hanamia sp.]